VSVRIIIYVLLILKIIAYFYDESDEYGFVWNFWESNKTAEYFVVYYIIGHRTEKFEPLTDLDTKKRIYFFLS